MPLSAGTCLGHYDVTALLGEGGMGQVWQATDTQLNRQVALKVLPDAFAADPDRLARFTREAQILASLNHPNIAAIYGIEEAEGVRALVLELVEGPTLADRVAQGAIPIEDALPIAKQIAEALEAAHEAGVIHRDLKPANIKVTEDGTVKVLDFGLAKALEPETTRVEAADVPTSPTLTAGATQLGVIMGTAAYMPPEQARGKSVDRRGDIWAFGCVLYELLSGCKAFSGCDASETMAFVLTKEVDWALLPNGTPRRLRHLLERCLTRDPKTRLRDIGEARLVLESAEDDQPDGPGLARDEAIPAGAPALSWRMPFAAFAAGALLVAGAMWGMAGDEPTTPAQVSRYTIRPPDGYVIGPSEGFALSANGDRLTYSAIGTGARQQLFLRVRGQIQPSPIAGTEDGIQPFFSPDGEWVGFFRRGELRAIALAGGPARTLASGDSVSGGGTWGPDDTIVFSFGAGLFSVDASGGTPRALTSPAEAGESHTWPAFLPDGSGILYTIDTGPTIEDKRIALLSFDTDAQKILIDGTFPAVLPTGHLVFARAGSLWAAPFDAPAGRVTGPAAPVVDDVQVNLPGGWAHYSVALDGTLVYLPRTGMAGPSRLVWVTRGGSSEPVRGLAPGV